MRLLFQADRNSLRKLVDASTAQATPEGDRRAAALRKVLDGAKVLPPAECRKIGDAVFAFFAPANSDILTTNINDHRPLAHSLGKSAVSPADLGV